MMPATPAWEQTPARGELGRSWWLELLAAVLLAALVVWVWWAWHRHERVYEQQRTQVEQRVLSLRELAWQRLQQSLDCVVAPTRQSSDRATPIPAAARVTRTAPAERTATHVASPDSSEPPDLDATGPLRLAVRQCLAPDGPLLQVIALDDALLRTWSVNAAPAAWSASWDYGWELTPQERQDQELARASGKLVYGRARAGVEYLPPEAARDVIVPIHIPINNASGAQASLMALVSVQKLLGEGQVIGLRMLGDVSVQSIEGKPLWRWSGVAARADHLSGDESNSATWLVVPLLTYPTSPQLQIEGHTGAEAFFGGRVPVVATLVAVLLIALVLMRRWREQGRFRSALMQEVQFRQAMAHSLATGVRATDLQGQITYVNAAFCRLVGYPESSLVGARPPYPFYDALQPNPELAWLAAWSDHGATPPELGSQVVPQPHEVQVTRADGRRIWVSLALSPLSEVHGHHIGWIASVEDITERKRWHDWVPVIRMGEMAASLAHDLSQPLAAATNYCSVATRRLRRWVQTPQPGSPAVFDTPEATLSLPAQAIIEQTELLQKTQDILTRARRTVAEIRPYLAGELSLEPTDLAVLAQDVVRRELADWPAERLNQTWASVPIMPLHRFMVRSVISNLIHNALESMAHLPEAERKLWLRLSLSDAQPGEPGTQSVLFALADCGRGVPWDLREAIFEPSVSTKAGVRGFGLYSCRNMIERHHGRLWYEPREQGGSVFQFTLPLVAKVEA